MRAREQCPQVGKEVGCPTPGAQERKVWPEGDGGDERGHHLRQVGLNLILRGQECVPWAVEPLGTVLGRETETQAEAGGSS